MTFIVLASNYRTCKSKAKLVGVWYVDVGNVVCAAAAAAVAPGQKPHLVS